MARKKSRLTSFSDLKEAFDSKAEQKRLAEIERIRLEAEREAARLPTDDELFVEAMDDVNEIPEFRKINIESPRGKRISNNQNHATPGTDREVMEELERLVGRRSRITLKDTDEYMEWASPSLTNSKRTELVRDLHEGRYSIGDFADLHGLTEDEAWEELTAFISSCVKRGLSCVKVIHGRGLRSPKEPVLKGAVKRWLKGPLSKYVLAFATARACDGGLGATYVLLKKK